MPALPGRHPCDMARRARRPRHERVVGVGDHAAVRHGSERLPPPPRDQPDLSRPVHLVTAQVQQDDHPRVRRLHHRRQVPLVDLEHGVRGIWRAAERGDESALHVGAERVRRDLLAERPHRGRHQPGRRGLAVGAGHQYDLAPGRELAEQVRGNPQSDHAADDGAVATPGQPRDLPGGLAERGRDASPDRKLAHGRRCYLATGADSAAAAQVRSSSRPIINKLVPKRREFLGFAASRITGGQNAAGNRSGVRSSPADQPPGSSPRVRP